MSKLELYKEFVHTLLSEPSKDLDVLILRMKELHGTINIPMLMAGSDGLASEGGEVKEIVKKVLYQGKPLDDDTQFHLLRELGDVIFYWFTVLMALNINPYDVLDENINKLKSRYPGGEFNAWQSENRKENDL